MTDLCDVLLAQELMHKLRNLSRDIIVVEIKMRASLFLLLGFAAFASAGLHLCRCGLFTTGFHGEYIAYELPGIDVPNCHYKHTCEGRCIDEFKELAAGGNLYAASGDTTVGQVICSNHHHSIDNEMVYLYSEICNGPWRYTGEHSMQKLCCDKDHQHYMCD
ncbi:uncharacterized protein LOC143034351 [Oratosquilla oratoria]|uniref:uncharacterized protein LOC143034351 n=1 Tax=Oratosquilla oratoria TaxID=337810 RepID=UPI003F7594FD